MVTQIKGSVWVAETNHLRLNALEEGVKADGTTDDSAALAALFTKAIANNVGVQLPAGTILINSEVAATLTDEERLDICGFGEGVTRILVSGSNGLKFTLNGNYWLSDTVDGSNPLVLRDFTVATTNKNTNTGISIIGNSLEGRPGPKILLEDITVRGYSTFTDQFAVGISILDCSDVWFSRCRIMVGGPGIELGTGLQLRASAATNAPVVYHLDNCQFYYGQQQIDIGNHIEGVYLTQCDFVGGVNGVLWDATASSASGLHWVGGHTNCKNRSALLKNVFDFDISNVLFYRTGTVANSACIELNVGGRFSITGNTFRGENIADGETAILITNSTNDDKWGGTIDGNSFHSFGTRAIWLAANSNYIHVGESNIYRECAERVLNQGANNNNTFTPKTYTITRVISVTGGSTTETFDLVLPVGLFRTTPGAGLIQANQAHALTLSGFYDFANSTATTAKFILRNPSGGNLVAGNYRVSIILFENVYSGIF